MTSDTGTPERDEQRETTGGAGGLARGGTTDRRRFVAGATATAAAMAAGSLAQMQAHAAEDDQMSSSQTPVAAGDDRSVAELAAALANGELTVRQLVQDCLDQIEAMDQQGPSINAVIELNPDALDVADALDRELGNAGPRGPLHGIPVLIKDNIATAGLMQTTAGSLALEGLQPTADSDVAALLREAGVVILGKTNLSEWANIRSTHACSGWSGRGGQTRNPYQLDRQASGSSSGSAAAVSAGYVPLAIGTETNGSIVSPASACGVVGVKPTVGLVSRYGVIPISHSQDTVGPLARSVADAAALLTVLAVQGENDPAQEGPTFQAAGGNAETGAAGSAEASPGGDAPPDFPCYPAKPEGGVPIVDYVASLREDALDGARIGVYRNVSGFTPLADEVFERSLAAMKDAGATLIDVAELPSDAERAESPDGLNVLLWELKDDLGSYLSSMLDRSSPVRTLKDVIAFNNEHAAEEMPYFGQELFEMSEATGGTADPAYAETAGRLQRWCRAEGIDAVLAEHSLDALVAPTNTPAAKIDLINGDSGGGFSSTPAAVAGYPLVTVPAGFGLGMPLGITFMGGAYTEETLLRLAYAFEQATRARRDPHFLPGAVIPPEEGSDDAG